MATGVTNLMYQCAMELEYRVSHAFGHTGLKGRHILSADIVFNRILLIFCVA